MIKKLTDKSKAVNYEFIDHLNIVIFYDFKNE